MRFALVSDASIHAIWIQVVFVDSVGANLKPASDLGMVTILVSDTDTALRELERVTGVQVTVRLCRVRFPVTHLCLGTKNKTSERRARCSGSSLLPAWFPGVDLLGGTSSMNILVLSLKSTNREMML